MQWSHGWSTPTRPTWTTAHPSSRSSTTPPAASLGYSIVQDPVHVHDFNATILHLLGVDHEHLTFRYQGRQFRLTDVHGRLVKGVPA